MREMAAARPSEVLMVEDNPGDVRLAMEALREGVVAKQVHVVEDGVEAMRFLHQRQRSAGGRLPDIILLDLNLPKKDGHEVLAEIRADEQLQRAVVIIFTSSSAEQDVRRAYELHAKCFVTKPSGFAELIDIIKKIETFWLTVVTLPCRGGADR